MDKSSLPFREEDLTAEEKRLLRKRFAGVLVFGSLIGFFAYYILFQIGSSPDFRIPLIIFAVFFFGILLFILILHGLNSLQTKKKVYTGTITEKRSSSTKFRNSNQQISYYVSLDGVEFGVDLYHYNQCHKGEKTELHVLRKSSVFKVVPFALHKAVDAKSAARNQLLVDGKPVEEEYEMEVQEYRLISKKIFGLVVFRFFIGFFLAVICYYLGLLIMVLSNLPYSYYHTVYYLLLLLLAFLFYLFNRKTVRYGKDMQARKKVFLYERVLDVEESNMPKPGPNSTTIYQGYTYRDLLFYYVKTSGHWIQVTKEFAESVEAGDLVKIGVSKYAKHFLSVDRI